MLTGTIARPRARRSTTSARRPSGPRLVCPPLPIESRRRIAAALARRAARERTMLALLIYERLRPAEVADALGVSRRQVNRTYKALLAELRVELTRRRAVSPRVRNAAPTRERRAA